MAEVSDYAAFWDEFKLRTDEKQKTVQFLSEMKKHNLEEITTMLSIGAGTDAT